MTPDAIAQYTRSWAPGWLMARLTGNSLRARYARGAAWSLAGAVASQGLSLAASMLIARILGARGFGELGMIQSSIAMFGVFGGLGLGLTATRHIAQLRMTDPARAGRIIQLVSQATLVSTGVVALILFLTAPLLAARVINAPALEREIRISAGLLFLNGLSATQVAALAGFEAFRRIARINLARGLVTLPAGVAGAYFWGLPGVLAAFAAAAAVTWLLGHLALRAECARCGIAPQVRDAWRERSVLWKFAAPAFLSGAIASPATWLGNAVLVNQPNGYWEMGIFNAANQWRYAIAFVPGVMMQPALPMLSNLYGSSSLPSYMRVLRGSLVSVFLIGSIPAAAVIAGSPWILATYGAEFAGGATSLRMLAVASVISCTAAVIGNAIASSGRMWAGFLLNLLWAAVYIALASHLVPRFGAAGLASATLGSYLVHAGSTAAYTRRALPRT